MSRARMWLATVITVATTSVAVGVQYGTPRVITVCWWLLLAGAVMCTSGAVAWVAVQLWAPAARPAAQDVYAEDIVGSAIGDAAEMTAPPLPADTPEQLARLHAEITAYLSLPESWGWCPPPASPEEGHDAR